MKISLKNVWGKVFGGVSRVLFCSLRPAAAAACTYGFTGSQLAEGYTPSLETMRNAGDPVAAAVIYWHTVSRTLRTRRNDIAKWKRNAGPGESLTPLARAAVEKLEQVLQTSN